MAGLHFAHPGPVSHVMAGQGGTAGQGARQGAGQGGQGRGQIKSKR